MTSRFIKLTTRLPGFILALLICTGIFRIDVWAAGSITVKDPVIPYDTMEQGTSNPIGGIIQADEELTYVEIKCYDMNSYCLTYVAEPYEKTFDIAYANYEIDFAALPGGIYKYTVIAETATVRETLIDKNVVVFSDELLTTPGTYILQPFFDGEKAVEVATCSDDAGLPFVVAPRRKSNYQVFTIDEGRYEGDNQVWIINYASKKNLWQGADGSLYQSDIEITSNVSAYAAQNWCFLSAWGGCYYIVSRYDGDCITVEGEDIVLREPDLSDEQCFILEPVEPYEEETTIYPIESVKLSKTEYTYNGEVKKPTVTVKDSQGNIISPDYYTVKYTSGRKNVGRYSVKVTFKEMYSGTVTRYFKIKPKGTAISSLTGYKKAFTVKWKKQPTQTTGYQIQYSTNKNFDKNVNTITISDKDTTSRKIKNLKSGKTYYVRVRTYKNVKINGEKVKYCSKWSEVKNVWSKGTITDKKPVITKASSDAPKTVILKWKKIMNATGYIIYRSTTKNGTYKKIKTISNMNTLTFKDTGLTCGKNYYYKIRAYQKNESSTSYSKYSDVKKVRVQISDREYFRNEIIKYYTKLWKPTGKYVCFDSEDMTYEDGTIYAYVLRYQRPEEEIEEIIAAGGTPSTNVLVTIVYVNTITGVVTDDVNDGYWEVKLP